MLKLTAQVISVVFHPLLVTTYVLVMFLIVNPYMFGYSHIEEGDRLILMILMTSFLLPGVSILLMKALGFVDNVALSGDKMNRILPLIATGIFYLWLTQNFYSNAQIPRIFGGFVLGATIGLFLAFFINLFKKISLHGVGMGGWLMLVVIMYRYFDFDSFSVTSLVGELHIGMNYWLYFVLMMAGVVGTSRLLLKAHDLDEVGLGFLVGFVGQIIAFGIIM